IAGVGPLTSFVIAAIAFAVAAVTSSNALLSGLFGLLTFVNLVLGLFNLVPAFPLDGGRILSSLLWWRSGSRQRGVHNAVRVGRLFAYLMIAGGVLGVFLGGGLNGAWMAILGWFLLSAGASEEAGSAVRSLLRSVPVSAAMTSPVVTLPDWVSVEQFLESVAPNHPFTTYPVHEPSGKLTGVVRLSDLVRLPAGERGRKHLIDVARPIAEVPVTNPREDLSALIQRIGCALFVARLSVVSLELAGQTLDVFLEPVPCVLGLVCQLNPPPCLPPRLRARRAARPGWQGIEQWRARVFCCFAIARAGPKFCWCTPADRSGKNATRAPGRYRKARSSRAKPRSTWHAASSRRSSVRRCPTGISCSSARCGRPGAKRCMPGPRQAPSTSHDSTAQLSRGSGR